jgi:hypothetical protein
VNRFQSIGSYQRQHIDIHTYYLRTLSKFTLEYFISSDCGDDRSLAVARRKGTHDYKKKEKKKKRNSHVACESNACRAEV